MLNTIKSVRGHHINTRYFTEKSIILDCGAHKGEFSTYLNQKYGSTCHMIEAMPSLYVKLPLRDNCYAHNYAVSSGEGSVSFFSSQNPESNSLYSTSNKSSSAAIEVDTISIAEFVNQHSIKRIDLLKLDIEGAEITVFNSMSDELLKSISQITVEFHDFIAELMIEDDVKDIKKRLKSLGFWMVVYTYSTNGDVLFLNKSFHNLFDYILARIFKPLSGLKRVFLKYFNSL